VLWQIGVVGNVAHRPQYDPAVGLAVISEVLAQHYPLDHQVIVYEAPSYPICDPIMASVFLTDLASARVAPASTLYVPAIAQTPPDATMMARLGLVSTTQ
jgi:hypothetical protein